MRGLHCSRYRLSGYILKASSLLKWRSQLSHWQEVSGHASSHCVSYVFLQLLYVQLCSCRWLTTVGAAPLPQKAHHSTTRTPVDQDTCSRCLLRPMACRRVWRSMQPTCIFLFLCCILTHTHCIQRSKHGFCVRSAEIDQKLQEIMKQTGYLKIDGQVRRTIDITQGAAGTGTRCQHVQCSHGVYTFCFFATVKQEALE